VELVSLARLRPAPWNANRVSAAVRAKVRRSIVEFGLVENLVARPHPFEPGALELVSGNHRLGSCASWVSSRRRWLLSS
jgi:ParB-like chromosome segregation protein Spo0J